MLSRPRPTGLARRAVLRAGLSAGSLGITGASLLRSGAQAAPPPTDILTGSHWGAFRARVEDGRIVAIRPWEKDPRPAPVLDGVLDSVYSPTRIKYPMVRRAWLEHGPGSDPDGRGDGDFVRVTWDKALDLVAKELVRVDGVHGSAGTFAGSYGWKSPGKLHNCQTLMHRMLKLKGGYSAWPLFGG
jgi:trimethylamine-N-oxide reductase (cytochrome c)